MPEREGPRVVLRGPDAGDGIILPMGGLQARIIRKASRTETGGHWALGEAWQDPGFDNPPHTHDEAEVFYVLEGDYTFYTDANPQKESAQAPSCSSHRARFMGSAPAQKAADFSASGRLRSKPRSSGVTTESGRGTTHSLRHVRRRSPPGPTGEVECLRLC